MNFVNIFTLLLAFFTNAALALPFSLPDDDSWALATREFEYDMALSTRQLLGAALRGLSKVPGKAGKKIVKEQGKNGGKDAGPSVQATAERMAANMAKMGKPQNMKCLLGMVEHMMQWGGANGNWPCDLPDPKKAAEAKRLEDAKKKAFASSTKVDPNSIGAKASAARAKAFAKVKS